MGNDVMNLKVSDEWLLRMAEAEGNGITSVGGLIYRVMSQEEAEAAYANAPEVPLSDERIDAIVKYATGEGK